MRAETARRIYERNAAHTAANKDSMHWKELVMRAKQQDALYLISIGESPQKASREQGAK